MAKTGTLGVCRKGAGGEASSTGESRNNHPVQENGHPFPLEGWVRQEAPAATDKLGI